AQRLPPTSSQRFEKTFRISQFVFDRDVRSQRSSEAVRTVTIVMTPPESACTPPPQVISPNTHWPTDWYDVVPMRVTDEAPSYIPSCTSAPSYTSFTKSVFVDDVPIDAQAFFSHRYVFGASAVGVRRVRVVWTAPDGTQSSIVRHVHIHSTQPRVHIDVTGLYKAQRRMEARIVQSAANDPWVEERAPLRIKSFVISGDAAVQCETCEGSAKVFAHKRAGTYAFHIQATRTITDAFGNTISVDAPLLVVPYTITPDHPPAIIAHALGKQISRKDPLDMVYDIQSTDGDDISTKTMRIYYDADNDGTCETLVSEHFGEPLSLPTFRHVGQYAYVVHAQERTTQPVLSSYVPATDGATATFTGYFVVDNYEPSSALYVDVPQPPPLIDVLYILDESLDDARASAVRDAKVSITNAYTSAHMRATVGIWDMRTYAYTQSASETVATGDQYPAATRPYCANGYCGTLSLTSVSNTPYSEDRGGFVTVTDAITASQTCTHTITGYYNRSGYWQLVTDSGDCPQSMPYDDGTYKGTLPRVSTTGTSCPFVGRPNATCTARFVATYTGPVYWSRLVWQPQWVTINRYVGTYSGTITKSVRQQLDASFFQAHSTKTFVYITDQRISSPTELEQLRTAHNTAQWVLVSGAAPQASFRHDAYVALTNPIEPALATVISTVQRNNPAVPVIVRLPGETIATRTATFDAEKDPLIEDEMWITQDATYFDYGQGFDTYAGEVLSQNKRDERWFPYVDTLSFQKVGKYTIYRRVRDQPHPDARFSAYRYRSNDSAIEVVVHRKPIADVDLSWTYDAPSGTYTTTWNDTSYDWDHRVSRSDRGIRARALTLYEEATAMMRTSIPSSLAPGRYTLTYMAQDIEGAWSDPLVRTIDLPVSPPMQLFAAAYADDSAFSLNNIAAGETISFAPRTKYPYKTHVEFWRDGAFVQRLLTPVGEHLGEKTWSPFVWNIPNTTPDGTYNVVLHAHGTDRTEQTITQSASQPFSVRVNTPIQLNSRITTADDGDVRTMRERKTYDLVATTTEYAQFVVVTAFAQTPYEQIIALRGTPISTSGTGQTRWTAPLTLSAAVPDGTYTFRWLSQTANNNVEHQHMNVIVQTTSPPTAQFTYTPHPPTEGDTLTLTDRSTDTDGAIASRIWTISSPTATTTATTPTVTLSPLQAGTLTVTLHVVDTSGLRAETTQSIVVSNLSLHAFVEHTASWEAIRTRWNTVFPSKPRDASTFWSGEALSLRAIASQANGVVPQSVTATLLSQPTSLSTNDRATYTSTIVRALPDGPYTIHFVAVWSNGHTETASVPFAIRGSMYDVLRWHRRL
ncbi:MAG: PKD domain-containing protein, partial [Paenibacillaceae bacterium]|nr:PKD domain-containing protein [Paenibacillaceae bacterium]